MNFIIPPLYKPSLKKELQQKIDQKTKPLGALGILEQIALQIGLIQDTTQPIIKKPVIAVFAGDHGIAKKGEVNPYPQEVTAQMVLNFLQQGAAINVFCNQNQIDLKIIDAGVNYSFEKSDQLLNAKIDFGTKNYQEEPAMTIEKCSEALQKGAEIIQKIHEEGTNCIGFGEMGIGNTSSASLLMAYFTKIPIAECVGSGTGLQQDGISNKTSILTKVFNTYQPKDPLEALATYGGFEIAMITGGILKAATLNMTIVIDGFIVTSALLAAHALHPDILDYCLFAHSSGEQGHRKMLEFLNKKPLLDLGLRLGEGTGAAIAFPIIKSSISFLHQMASFESAGVSDTDK